MKTATIGKGLHVRVGDGKARRMRPTVPVAMCPTCRTWHAKSEGCPKCSKEVAHA